MASAVFSCFRNKQSSFLECDRTTYLQRCTVAIEDSESIAKKEDRISLAYKTAGIALKIFFSIAAVASAVLVGLYIPVFLPMTGVVIALSTQKVRGCIQKAYTRAASHELTASRIRSIAEEYVELCDEDNFEDSIPLLAHCNYWERMGTQYKEQTASKLSQSEVALETDSRMKLFMEASKERQKFLIAKTCQAFILAVMRHPDFKGNQNDIYTLNDFSIPADLNRRDMPLVQNAIFGQSTPALVFKGKCGNTIGLNELLALTPQELSTHFLKAMS